MKALYLIPCAILAAGCFLSGAMYENQKHAKSVKDLKWYLDLEKSCPTARTTAGCYESMIKMGAQHVSTVIIAGQNGEYAATIIVSNSVIAVLPVKASEIGSLGKPTSLGSSSHRL